MKIYTLLTLCTLSLGLSACGEEKSKTVNYTAATEAIEKTKEVKSTQQTKGMQNIANMQWYTDIEKAFASAQKAQKNVIVMVGEDDCRYCRKMKEKTLTDPAIADKMKKYILVSLKRSDKESLKALPEFTGNIPSFFVMKANKALIEPIVGYFNPEDFLFLLDELEA